MKRNRVARGVRVKFNETFKPKNMSDEYIIKEPIIFITDEHIYEDIIGSYIFVSGGSLINSATAYLTELDVVFDTPETPLYSWEDMPKDYHNIVSDWRDTDGLAEEFIKSIETVLGGYVYEDPSTVGTDSLGYLVSKNPLNLDEIHDICLPPDWDDEQSNDEPEDDIHFKLP